jgi:hypothetical protein
MGDNVREKLVAAGGGAGPGFENVGAFRPPPIEQAVREGLMSPAAR